MNSVLAMPQFPLIVFVLWRHKFPSVEVFDDAVRSSQFA